MERLWYSKYSNATLNEKRIERSLSPARLARQFR